MNELSDAGRLSRIGLTPPILAWLDQEPAAADPTIRPMRVVEVQRDALTLHDGDVEWPGRPMPALVMALEDRAYALAVGDWVLAQRNVHGQWWVHHRMPPQTQIARRLHDGREKITRTVIVSNVDTALLVMGLDHDFNLRRLERFLALVRLAGVSAVVVLTKADLGDDVDQRCRRVAALLPPDVAVVPLDSRDAGSCAALQPWLQPGRTLVMLGSSGTGKSTLTNTLVGRPLQDIGGTRHGDGRGRHTTTSRSLHLLACGACIIDTPGIRTLRLDSEAGDVQAVFDDIARLAPTCRFRNCRHEHEPGCAVREAVASERVDSFHKLLREAQRDSLSLRQRQERLAEWKMRARHARQVARAKGR